MTKKRDSNSTDEDVEKWYICGNVSLENSLQAPQIVKHSYHMTPLPSTLKRNENTCPQKILYTNTYNVIHNSQKVETDLNVHQLIINSHTMGYYMASLVAQMVKNPPAM